ncbi:MAG TPA: dihydroorotase family protein [Gaiellaceae bacterium]|nr:dihydroorotase family protein [Gaiellaceae bacterium]
MGAVAGFDLAVRGGLVVRPSGSRRTNVYVRGGRVALVDDEQLPARAEIDAADLLVLPGMVDTHVHFMDPADPTREDFPTGSAAAACAGVTTVVEHTHARPVRTAQELREKRDYLRDRSVVDFGLAAHAWPDRLDAIAELWRAGVTYVKAFTCTTHGVPGLDAAHLLELFRRAASLGTPCLVHCEDESLTAAAEQALHTAGREDPLVVSEWRNRDAEAVAVAVTALLARRTGANAVVAHASSVEIVDLAARERDAGARVLVETCPQYLLLREDELRDHGAFRKFTPPARAQSTADLERMWEAVADRRVHHVASDHAPSTAAQKTSGSIWDVHFGLPGIDTTLPVLLDGAHAGRLGYERIAEAYAEAPARAYGLWPRKGALQEGSDADLVLVDPGARWTVRDEDVRSKAGWSPFAGRTFVGRAVATYLRGELVAEDRCAVAAAGTGRFVAGAGASGDG